MKQFTYKEKVKILRSLKTMTWKEVSEKYDVSEPTMLYWMRKAKIPKKVTDWDKLRKDVLV